MTKLQHFLNNHAFNTSIIKNIEDTLRYVLGASGTNHYTFTGKGLNGAVNDPTLTLDNERSYLYF